MALMNPSKIAEGKRILGIDYGARRIGIAISDPLKMISQSIGTVKNDCALFDQIQKMLEQYNVGLIIVGMPYNLKGACGKKALEVGRFISELKKRFAIDVIEWDERFTSTIAHQTMIDMGMKKKQRQQKARVDEIAASLILQSYLDVQR